MKLSCLAPRVSTALAVISLALASVDSATAQFAPYGNAYQGQPSYQPHQAYGPQYSAVAQSNMAYGGGQQFMPGPQLARPQYAPQPQYVAMAQQPAIGNVPPMPQPAEAIPPGPMQQPAQMAPQPAPMDYSQNGGYESYSGNGMANGNCGAGYSCDGYGSYSQPNYGCDSYGTCNVGYASCAPRRHWFGGIYGLLMERTDCDYVPLAFYTPDPAPGYYPTDDEIIMTTEDLDHDLLGGAEVRFGATFACCGGAGGYGGCCDPCGLSCGGCGTLGWEVGYWALSEDTASASYSDGAGSRLYGMKSYQGLEFNYAGNWRPVNHAYDYAPPTTDNYTAWGNVDIRVTSIEARRNFSVQNVEWNLVCLPTIGGGCATCDPCAGGSYGGGGCDSCGGGSCGGGCGQGGHFGGRCGAYCYTGPRCQCSTLLGVRYFRFDEDFMFRANYDAYQMPGNTYLNSGYLAHYIEADNHLVGFQVGGNGCYHLGCSGRCALHFSSNAGIYGNYIEKNEYFGGTGAVRFANGDQDIYNIMAEDENIAFLGELRLGASYQCTCNCRVYGGYRALGVTGVALTTNQLNAPYITPVQSGYIDCSGSVFLHGLQSGVEFMY